jgi:pimeloyl-ACP methyl ester carboxylesterase
MARRGLMRARLFLAGWLLVLGGGALAHAIQTSDGITVQDVRIALPDQRALSGLLYTPPDATETTPAPAVLAVHGYINSRETQSGFAIEFARRGLVVLALDQTGHGFSDGPAFSDGYGGPAGLQYLRRLPIVDSSRVGMEGHSMGGWTALAAAVAVPDGYRSIALVGSSTGASGPTAGTAEFPRNLAVIFSLYDEFAGLMWGVRNASESPSSGKLQAAFGVDAAIEPGRLYGEIEKGTARRLTIPVTTHPGDHLSRAAIGDAVHWMNLTLGTKTTLHDDDQIWFWKELGTGMALIGGLLVLLGAFEIVLGTAWLSSIARPGVGTADRASAAWWARLASTAALPALTYFPLTSAGAGLRANAVLPQGISNQILVWALGTGAVALALPALVRRPFRHAPAGPAGGGQSGSPFRIAVAALVSVLALFLAVVASDVLFKTDLRYWVVALKLPAYHHWSAFAAYVAPITAFFFVSQQALHQTLALRDRGPIVHYATGVTATAGGMFALTAGLYLALFATGHLPVSNALFSIIAIQFVPILAATGVIAVFTWRRTNQALPGALICGLFVTWYLVAGQATHVF